MLTEIGGEGRGGRRRDVEKVQKRKVNR